MAKGTYKSDWRVWFDDDWNHLSYSYGGWTGAANESRPADYTFIDTLTYHDYERGRSSVVVVFKDSQGHEQRMFFAEFMRLVEYLYSGALDGKWGYEKNGSNTGIYRIEG